MKNNLTHNDPTLIQKLIIRSQKNQTFPEINNELLNQDCESSISISLFGKKENKNWINYSLELKNPNSTYSFSSDNFLLCLSPVNELKRLLKDLQSFLTSSDKHFYRFEPVEPCFEFTLEKDLVGEVQGIKLHFWVDSGNAEFAYYTWDAFGMRLYTNQDEIKSFMQGLESVLQKLESE